MDHVLRSMALLVFAAAVVFGYAMSVSAAELSEADKHCCSSFGTPPIFVTNFGKLMDPLMDKVMCHQTLGETADGFLGSEPNPHCPVVASEPRWSDPAGS